MNNGRIIEDARVLTADYLPNSMVHREGEKQEISRSLEPILEEGEPVDMLVYGPPGTGKTAMSRYVVEELKKETFVNLCYVNCFGKPSKFEIFYELLDKRAKVPRDGTSTEKVIEMFEEKIRNAPAVVVLDEVDQISNDEILFELSRFNRAGLIMISNSKNLFAGFDERVRSRFSGLNRIRFRRYSDDEIFDILERRRKYGLNKDCVNSRLLKKISGHSNGDARVAINTLKISAQKAENRDLDKITEAVLEESLEDARDRSRVESLEKLNRHQEAIYGIIEEEGEIDSGELFEMYREKVEDDRSRRTFRRYMDKMEAYGLVDSAGKKKGTSYSLAE